MITISFACGHREQREDVNQAEPQCAQCGETRVQTVKAAAPRFKGLCRGPVVTNG